jgi:hypothetical protein
VTQVNLRTRKIT